MQIKTKHVVWFVVCAAIITGAVLLGIYVSNHSSSRDSKDLKDSKAILDKEEIKNKNEPVTFSDVSKTLSKLVSSSHSPSPSSSSSASTRSVDDSSSFVSVSSTVLDEPKGGIIFDDDGNSRVVREVDHLKYEIADMNENENRSIPSIPSPSLSRIREEEEEDTKEDEEENEEHENIAPTLSNTRIIVYKRRNPTCWTTSVHKFVMPFHNMVLGSKDGAEIVFGVKGNKILVTEDPKYVYDSSNTESYYPTTKSTDSIVSLVHDNPRVIRCTARFFEYTIRIHGVEYRILINISYRGEFGDILIYNKETDAYEWFDDDAKMFVPERPAKTATLAVSNDKNTLKLKSLSRKYAIPVPVMILNEIDMNDMLCTKERISIDLLPETALTFASEPPPPPLFQKSWIVDNLIHRALTEGISAVVTVV